MNHSKADYKSAHEWKTPKKARPNDGRRREGGRSKDVIDNDISGGSDYFDVMDFLMHDTCSNNRPLGRLSHIGASRSSSKGTDGQEVEGEGAFHVPLLDKYKAKSS